MITFAWWNLQNLFDIDDDPISKDFEYTPEYGWTEEVFNRKMDVVAEGIRQLAEPNGLSLFACCEIEKDSLLQELVRDRAGLNMKVVPDKRGTSDLRGIDTAIAYNPSHLKVLEAKSHVVHLRYATRDIFEVRFEVKKTGEEIVVIASHWPSRRIGKYRSDPFRIAVAEQISYLVQRHVKLDSDIYEEAREAEDLERVRERWETPVIILGDFNDQPSDRSVVDHLRGSSEPDRVKGGTNDIDSFRGNTADYRAQDVFLFNPMWKFMPDPKVGTYFIDGTRSEKFPNRYQILDQVVVSRGLLKNEGLRLDTSSVEIVSTPYFATSGGRPRQFSFKRPKKRGGAIPAGHPKGLSDHLPVKGRLLT